MNSCSARPWHFGAPFWLEPQFVDPSAIFGNPESWAQCLKIWEGAAPYDEEEIWKMQHRGRT